MTKMISILIADNNPLIRAGLGKFLKEAKEINVVGEANSCETTLNLVKELQPDIVLLDISFCQESRNFGFIDQLRQHNDSGRVVLMIDQCQIAIIVQALIKGALGVTTRDISGDELAWVVSQVARHQRSLSSVVVNTLIDYLLQNGIPAIDDSSKILEVLTQREQEVFKLLAQGLSNQEIAEQLSLSPSTVKSHTSNILSKLGLNNRAQIVLLATGKLLVELSKPEKEMIQAKEGVDLD